MSESSLPGTAEELEAALQLTGNQCFGCGPNNPQGLRLVFAADTSTPGRVAVRAQVHLTRLHEGPPGYLHGGIIATLLDEAMDKLNRPLGVIAMTRNMEIDYLRPVPLFADITVTGAHLRREGRKLYHEAELLGEDGTVLARGKGLFLVVDPDAVLGETARRFRR